MKTRIIRLIATGTLIFALGFAARVAGADWRIGCFVGYQSPNFGEVNEWDDRYEEWLEVYGVKLNLGAATAFGVTAEYGISPNLGLRGEITSFTTRTSGRGWGRWGWYEERFDVDYELAMTSLVLSGIYRVPLEIASAYMGAGVGSFATRVEVSEKRTAYEYGSVEWVGTQIFSQSDSPIGLELLGGIGYDIQNLSLAGEVKYTIAKADVGLFGVADLSGLSLVLVALYQF